MGGIGDSRQQQPFALVSMSNKDVYYVSQAHAKELMALIDRGEQAAFFVTTDIKSGAQVAIATGNISSIVVRGGL